MAFEKQVRIAGQARSVVSKQFAMKPSRSGLWPLAEEIQAGTQQTINEPAILSRVKAAYLQRSLGNQRLGEMFSAANQYSIPTQVQRKCNCGRNAATHGECTECRNKRLNLQRKVTYEGNAVKAIQRRESPYIKKITVHLNPPQSAELEWKGTPPPNASGSDHFQVSTGKGYSNPDDEPGTCTRDCCGDPMTQCAPPWNQPERIGSCCTYHGSNFWTGTPLEEHNGWKWWTPIQPYYSRRGIALHSHYEVTGQPIGHGCVRMDEANAKRIYDFSHSRHTNVTIDGRAAPVDCAPNRQCNTVNGSSASKELQSPLKEKQVDSQMALGNEKVVAGLEGIMS